MSLHLFSSHTSGRPVRGNTRITLEVRPPMKEINPNKTTKFPSLTREVVYVSVALLVVLLSHIVMACSYQTTPAPAALLIFLTCTVTDRMGYTPFLVINVK